MTTELLVACNPEHNNALKPTGNQVGYYGLRFARRLNL
jgi:hypothetical protein